MNEAADFASDSLSRNVLRLTPDEHELAGSAWYVTNMPISGGFTTTFTFRMYGADSPGADGLAFVIQNDPRGTTAIGGSGGWMGYGYPGLYNTVALEFDTYFNEITNETTADANGNHVAIHKSLGSDPIDAVYYGNLVQADTSPGVVLNDGFDHMATFTYYMGFFSVSLDGNSLFGGPVSVDLASVLGSDYAYVGFTAGTGGLSQNHDIVNWNFNPIPEPTSLLLLGTGLGILWLGTNRRRRK